MRNLITIFSLLIVTLISGCSDEKSKNIDMGTYLIKVPNVWKKIKIQGIDSNVSAILTSSGDTIISDYGKNSEKFEETNKVFSKEQIQKYKAMKMDTENLFWSNTPEIDQAQGTFLNEYYMYENIDNYKVKFRISKNNKKGITGIFVDSLFNTGNRLTIYSKNLNNSDKDLLINSFYTIKFKEK